METSFPGALLIVLEHVASPASINTFIESINLAPTLRGCGDARKKGEPCTALHDTMYFMQSRQEISDQFFLPIFLYDDPFFFLFTLSHFDLTGAVKELDR